MFVFFFYSQKGGLWEAQQSIDVTFEIRRDSQWHSGTSKFN
jgi:hypothetical protein